MPLSADMIYVFLCDGSKILTNNEKYKTKKYSVSIAKNISILLANAVVKYFAKTIRYRKRRYGLQNRDLQREV